MRLTQIVVIAIAATMLASVVAVTSATRDASVSAVTGRVAYVPCSAKKEAGVEGGQFQLVYLKLPSGQPVNLRVAHPLLGSDISSFKWSPDASRLLFIARLKNQLSGGGEQLDMFVPWVLDLRTGTVWPISQPSNRNCWRADWLSDGRRIVLQALVGRNPELAWWGGLPQVLKGGDTRLILVDLRSKREKTIWRSNYPYHYECSPTRDEILIYMLDDTYRLMATDRRVRWRRKIRASDMLDAMAFSPDGGKIAVYVGHKLHIVSRGTGTRQTVYTSVERASARELAWSADGHWIAFREYWNESKSIDPPMPDFAWDVFAVNVETRKVHRFPDEAYRQGKYSYRPTVLGWTKDGNTLALNVPADNGKWPPVVDRDVLVLCPLAGGKGVPVADITSGTGGLAWLPR